MKKGWQVIPIGSLGKLFNGNSINEEEKRRKYSNLEKGYPYIATKDILVNGCVVYENGIKIPFDTQFKIAHKNTVLICAEGGSAGKKISITDRDVCFGNKLFAIEVNNSIMLPRLLFYYFFTNKFRKDFLSNLVGIIGGVNQKKFANIRVIVPPHQEQQRIVEKLDNAFAKIDAIKENAEKNLKEAELLFNSVLAEEIDNRGATILPLEKIVDSQSYISYGIVQPGDDQVNGVSIVRPIDLRFKTLTSIEGFKKTKQSISDAYKRSILDGREILMCVRGTTGIVSMSSPALKGCNVTRGIVPLRIKDDIKRNYVYYALLAPCCQKYINEHTNGTALKQINIADVKTIPIAIPDSLSLQQLLVNKLNFIEERCIKLRSVCQNIAKECDALKQTILRKAFSGEL